MIIIVFFKAGKVRGINKMFGLVFIRRIWDLTADEVADKIGVKRAAVAAWERKKSIPLKRLRSLSELFNGLDEEYFSKELTEIDKLNIQQFKTFKYVNRYIKEKQINTQISFFNNQELCKINMFNSFFNAYKHYSENTIPTNKIELDLYYIICKNGLNKTEE